MSIVRRGLCCAAALFLAGTAGWASPPFRQAATPGTRHYLYTVLHTTNGAMEQGYRVGFDLVSGADGSVDAIVLSSESLAGGHWTRDLSIRLPHGDARHCGFARPGAVVAARAGRGGAARQRLSRHLRAAGDLLSADRHPQRGGRPGLADLRHGGAA